MNSAVFFPKRNSLHHAQGRKRIRAQGKEKLFHRFFAFSKYNDVRAGFEILRDVGAGLRPSDNGLPPRVARHSQNLDNLFSGHQVGVDSQHARRLRLQMRDQIGSRGKRGVKHVHAEPLLTKMRTDIENAKRNVRLTNLEFLGVFRHKITVREEEISYGRLQQSPSARHQDQMANSKESETRASRKPR